MSDVKISQLPVATAVSATDVSPIVHAGITVKATGSQIVTSALDATPVTVAQGGTGVTSLGSGVVTFLQTPSSANLRTAVTDETGTGSLVFATSPTLVTPILGTPQSGNFSTGTFTWPTFNQNTTGTASNVTGIVGVANGGTNLSSYTLGDTLYASGTTTISKLAGNTTTQVKFLQQTGTGSVSAAPEWAVISQGSINTQYGAFHYDDTTSLSETITQNQTTIPVVSTTNFSATGSIIIESEIITYTGITSTSFTGCTRGVAGSSNSSHNSGIGVSSAQITAANTPTTLQINTTDLSNGVTLNTTTSTLSVAINGTYNIQYSAQLFNGTVNQDLVNIWYDLDGAPVAASGSWGTIPPRKNSNTPGSSIITVNLFLNLTTSSALRLRWLSVDGTGVIATYPPSASPLYPAAPGVILTVNQVS